MLFENPIECIFPENGISMEKQNQCNIVTNEDVERQI